MLRFLLPLLAASAALAADPLYEISGRIDPPSRASVSLYGDTTPFSDSTLAGVNGRFRFRKIRRGTYTLSIVIRSRGEARQTVQVGPGTADQHGRVDLKVELKDSDFTYSGILRRHSVSARELTIPGAAMRDYREAQKDLSRHDVDAAVKHLEEAVARAPQFAAAWNNLGTIAYQTRKFERAEECFRQALAQDPQFYEAMVNLGGVLVNLHRLDEALAYNEKAATARPNDALANSQLGVTYFLLGDLDLAVKYLQQARQIDPAHFSNPQLLLYQIHMRRGERAAAAESLEDFLRYHPDWPQAAQLRKILTQLRAAR
ncbi:MAG TPA: tetratricopeptide repeat protein [Bryobacteraceae bacterium]|nr:tetratricopeptide repeat protein [Bryobacteraceae bacterium]